MRFATTKLEAFTRGSLARRDTEISSIGRSLFNCSYASLMYGSDQDAERAPSKGTLQHLGRDQTD